MPFPEVARVIYGKNPLDQVICQLRFSPILKIDAEIPAEFQEMVRKDYPNYSEKSEWDVQIPSAIKGQVPVEILRELTQTSGSKNYEFSSEDGKWRVNLTRTFVALTTKEYRRWEEFKGRLVGPLNALTDTYSPTHFTRIGLRYVNVIRRSRLGLDDVDWKELLQPYLLGILGSPEVGRWVRDFGSSYEIQLLDGQSVARVVTSFVEPADDGEKCYMIDSDFFSRTKTGIDDAGGKLDYFHDRASRLIQWCMTPRLHTAMEPDILC